MTLDEAIIHAENVALHLSAIKERLCNQRRWGEAEEYERLIERFMAFASACRAKMGGTK